jgi:hypothetical protein
MTDVHPGVELVAYPPRPNPPLILAFAIIAAGLTAPFLFLRAGSPSLFLGIGSLSLALAGIVALAGALNGRRLYSADPICRPRARITAAGITLYKSPPPAPGLFFPRHQISNVQFLTSALIVHTKETHPSPGRHAVRFGKLETPRADIVAAIRPLEHP